MSSHYEREIRKGFPDLDPDKAKELAKLLEDAESSEAVDDAMDKANEILRGHGVEAIQGDGAYVDKYWRDTILLYVNMGDTYDTTICYDTDEDEFIVGSWGDFMEEWEQESDEDEDEEEDKEEDDEDEGEGEEDYETEGVEEDEN